MIKQVFFDAAGTLFHLPKGVGFHYALVGSRMGLELDPAALDSAFRRVWQSMPARPTTAAPRADDDKGWWADLVDRVLEQSAPGTAALDRDAFFEAAYSHFAEPDVWELYPETIDVLEELRSRYQLGVISNFDGRLRMILKQLGVTKYFTEIVISSDVGADKPEPLIFRRAVELAGITAAEAMHVGDDPVRDWEGAGVAGLSVFRLDRSRNSLRDVLTACAAY